MNLDLTMVQNVIGNETAGYFGVCATFGKNLVALSMIFANVVYSYTLKDKDNPFWLGLVVNVIVFLLAAGFLALFGEPALWKFFSGKTLRESERF